jgi:hypothetical protein
MIKLYSTSREGINAENNNVSIGIGIMFKYGVEIDISSIARKSAPPIIPISISSKSMTAGINENISTSMLGLTTKKVNIDENISAGNHIYSLISLDFKS